VYAFDDSSPLAPAIRLMIRRRYGDTPISLNVHPNDEMLAFSVNNTPTPDMGTMAYFRAGMQICDTFGQIADWRFGGLGAVGQLCDFACGYGRSSRFLAGALPTERISAYEILPEAVQFQSSQFGVNGWASEREPERVRFDREFDMIVVSSLFSHLPDHTFGRWLKCLFDALAPGGILVISVHDEAIIGDHGAIDETGIRFIPMTEIGSLDVEDYGATFVTEAYVAAQIEEVCGHRQYWRLPQALCFTQDLYVIPRHPIDSLDPPPVSRGAGGAVDAVTLASPDRLVLTGWAADMDRPDDGVDVSVWLDDRRLGTAAVGNERPDVAAHFQRSEPGFTHAGWSTTLALPPGVATASSLLLVLATTHRGSEFVLDCAPLGRLVDLPTPPPDPRRDRIATRLEHVADLYRREGSRGLIDKTLSRGLRRPGR
jgi:SAM-dependent methyltransferase